MERRTAPEEPGLAEAEGCTVLEEARISLECAVGRSRTTGVSLERNDASFPKSCASVKWSAARFSRSGGSPSWNGFSKRCESFKRDVARSRMIGAMLEGVRRRHSEVHERDGGVRRVDRRVRRWDPWRCDLTGTTWHAMKSRFPREATCADLVREMHGGA